MSVQVANASLSAAVLGTTGKISFGKALPPATLSQQMRPQDATGGATLLVWNESGCGLTCRFPITGKSFTIPAGGWRQLMVPPSEVELDYTVSYVLPNAPVTQLLADLYLPGEAVDASSVLGNSPIGLAGSVPTSVTQVINDANPAVQAVLEATPTSGPLAGVSSAKINNDGSGYLSGALLTFDAAGNVTGCTSVSWGKEQGAFAELSSFMDANGAAAAISSQQAGAATYLQFICWNGAAAVSPLGLGTKALTGGYEGAIINDIGALAKVGGQLSVGSFGVPVIVAQAIQVHVTTTAVATILSFTIPADGLYRISGSLIGNNGGTFKPSLIYTFTGRNSGISQNQGLGTGNGFNFDGSTTFGNGFELQVASGAMSMKNATNLSVTYQDAAGTPNDFMTIVVERLA